MKLVSLNVEGDKRWGWIKPFLFLEQPDVVCLQEVFKSDVTQLAKEFSMNVVFEPMWQKVSKVTGVGMVDLMGVAILSRFEIGKTWSLPYHVPGPEIVPYDSCSLSTMRQSTRSLVLLAEVEHQEEKYIFATTHFTWTPDGLPNEYQRADAKEVLQQLESVPESILCGDFNIPRGFNDLYELFTKRYVDAIPPSYISSIDLAFHRVKDDEVAAARLGKFMIDYVFLTQKYEAKEVRLVSGVSDHCAVVAEVFIKK